MDSTQLQILNELMERGGTGNVMEILDYNSFRFEEGFALAIEMQNADLVKLLYSNFNKNLVIVELTLLGESKTNHHG